MSEQRSGTTSAGKTIADTVKRYSLGSWTAQENWQPVVVDRGEGVYFLDADGKRYLDWSSQMINVNIGHGVREIHEAISNQLDRIAFCGPAFATEARAKASELLASVTPENHRKSFFTTGGADANENAMKIARLYTGRQKIIGRYRAYHGGTFGAMSAGGDPRRIANEPGLPWTIQVHDPYAYRNPVYQGRTQEEGDRLLIEQMEETIRYEGPETIAAIIVEGHSGSSGAFDGGPEYWNGIQRLCDRYGILLIVDEILSAFGRTGKWFGFEHHPGLRPDIITMSKGLTSAYVPMGAVSVSEAISGHFDRNTLWAGLTYSAHPLGCAAAAAVIGYMKEHELVDRAAKTGIFLEAELDQLADKHPCVGERRGRGLLHVYELVRNPETREPLSPFHQPQSEAMQRIKSCLMEHGLSTLVRWNWIFHFPPLIITEDQIKEGLAVMDKALDIGDEYVV